MQTIISLLVLAYRKAKKSMLEGTFTIPDRTHEERLSALRKKLTSLHPSSNDPAAVLDEAELRLQSLRGIPCGKISPSHWGRITVIRLYPYGIISAAEYRALQQLLQAQ